MLTLEHADVIADDQTTVAITTDSTHASIAHALAPSTGSTFASGAASQAPPGGYYYQPPDGAQYGQFATHTVTSGQQPAMSAYVNPPHHYQQTGPYR